MKCYTFILLFLPNVLLAQRRTMDVSCIPAITINASQNNICTGSAVTFRATITNNGTAGVYKWKKNGLRVNSDNNPVYTATGFNNGDVVVCEYSCKTLCGTDTTVQSNAITVTLINDVTPWIVVSNVDTLICEGELTTFTAKAFYGSAVPSYQWMVNGNPVGTNSPLFVTNTITNGSRIECVLTISSPSCPGFSQSASSQLTVYVYPMVHPAITIKPSKTQICKGEEVTFTATANGGAYPSFAWMVNGKQTGENAPALITSTLKDGDTVSCTVTIDQDSRCHTTTTSAGSNKIVMQVHDFVNPAVTIAAPVLDVCAGTPISFTATPENAGGLTLYQWLVNGNATGGNSPVFSNTRFANGDKVSCSLTTNIPGCPFSATASSNSEVVKIRDVPSIRFSPPEISVMTGEAAQLQAIVSGTPAVFVWTPAGALLTPQSLTSSTVPITSDTTFTLIVVDANGCTATDTLKIKALHRLYIPSAFTPNRDGKNDVFRIPPDASIALQEFTVFDRWGNVVFRTTDITKGWNGMYNGQILDTGTYVYLIKGIVQGKALTAKGNVTLVR